MRQRDLLILLVLGVVSHLLIHAFSLQLAAAGRRAVRLVSTGRSAGPPTRNCAAPVPPPSEQTPDLSLGYGAPSSTIAPEAGADLTDGEPVAQGCDGSGASFTAPASFAGGEPIAARRSLNVLLIHEHHLKAIGSDLRLLGVLMQLRSLGHTASVRAPAPHHA
jgi:hypothetical protein